MNLPTWYSSGLVSVEGGGTTVSGTGSLWGSGGTDDNIMVGDLFCVPSQPLVPAVPIAAVTANGELELLWPWPGTNVATEPYIIRYVGIIERSTRANRMALERMGEVSAFFDVQVDDTPARLALETVGHPLRAGYRVLVSNIGDGTAAIYSKASGTYDDWTAPAPYSGPKGQKGWSPQIVYVADGARRVARLGGYVGGEGSAPTANVGDYLNADGTWTTDIAEAAEMRGPPGQNGTGTGNVNGPASATAGRLVIMDDNTGKLIHDTTGLSAVRQSLARADLGVGLVAGRRNKIDNGRFNIWQRGVAVLVGAGLGGHTADRWYVNLQSGISCTANKLNSPAGAAYGRHYAGFSFTGTGIAGSNVRQNIEGVDTLAGKLVTASFVISDTVPQNFTLAVQQSFGTGGSPSATVYTPIQTFAVSSTFGGMTQIVFTVPSIAGKIFGTNGDDRLELIFISGAANAHTMYLANVSLVEGDASNEGDPSSPIHPSLEELICERFYETATEYSDGGVSATGVRGFTVHFRTAKRSIPTLAHNGAATTFLDSPTKVSFRFYTTVNAPNGYTWTASSDLI